ncbi:hypothetical protein P2F65_17940 [Knoellia sp. p5-6-4]|uniref:hypothetical protein n=1 Tax=Knoellia sp. p5-6-4 TaxID=3032286 RepID=UPI0023DC282B|nr:hypothetical protein [Knoellia sp. p5-6-4]MDF2146865.1 hypothetical protein [Knoellia sp. p5-6-4]
MHLKPCLGVDPPFEEIARGGVEVATSQRGGVIQLAETGGCLAWSALRRIRQRRRAQSGRLLLVKKAHLHGHIITDLVHCVRHVRVDSGRVRATIAPVPRLLSDRERDILDLLLSVDFPGAVELRQQGASVYAEREGMIIDLVVSAESPRATVVNRTPVQAVVDGDGYDGGVLLFVDDGRLSALE